MVCTDAAYPHFLGFILSARESESRTLEGCKYCECVNDYLTECCLFLSLLLLAFLRCAMTQPRSAIMAPASVPSRPQAHQLANDYLETTLAAVNRACSGRCQMRATDMKDSTTHEQVLYLVPRDALITRNNGVRKRCGELVRNLQSLSV